MAQKRGGGKPRKINQEIKRKIVAGMAQGRMLMELCDELKIGRTAVWYARQDDLIFDSDFERAALNGITVNLETATKDLATAQSRDDVLKYKELLRHAEWMAEKRLAIYQPTQRQEVTHQGPMVVGWNVIEGNATVLKDDQVNRRARKLTTTDKLPAPAQS